MTKEEKTGEKAGKAAAKQFEEADFRSAVMARLKDLHEIKLPGSSVLSTLLDNGRTP